MKKALLLLIIMVLALLPVSALAGPPLDLMEKTVNEILSVLRDPAFKPESTKEAQAKKIEIIIRGVFDYVELSKRTLGKSWNDLSLDQRKEFTDLYSTLLRNTYMDRIQAYSDEKVNFTQEIPLAEGKVEVKSLVNSASKQIPIDYRLFQAGGQWRIYDIQVEGISLVKNYRTQFSEILSKNPPAELINVLRKKVESPKKASSSKPS
jgi:phospholipid transport system substrate-binding protein